MTRPAGRNSRIGDEHKLRNLTEFFSAKPDPKSLITLRKYTLPRNMGKLYRQAIRKAKKGKTAGPDEVPMELFHIFPAAEKPAFTKLMFELFASGARLQCVMKD